MVEREHIQHILNRLEVGDLVRVAVTREGTVTDTDAAAGTFAMTLVEEHVGGDGDTEWRFLAEDSGLPRVGIIAKAQTWQLGDVVLWRDRVYEMVEVTTATGATDLAWQRVGQARKFEADHVPADAELLVRDGIPQAPRRDKETRQDNTGIAPGNLRAARTSTAEEAAAVSADREPTVTPLTLDGPVPADPAVTVLESTANGAPGE